MNSNMIYKVLLASAGVAASLVTAGLVPAAWAVVATAVAGAAGFFHDAPEKK